MTHEHQGKVRRMAEEQRRPLSSVLAGLAEVVVEVLEGEERGQGSPAGESAT